MVTKEGERMTLKTIRLKCNLTLLQVAEYIGCSKQGYWNYEKGIRKLPLDKANKLAELYNIPLGEVYLYALSNQNVNPCITNIISVN